MVFEKVDRLLSEQGHYFLDNTSPHTLGEFLGTLRWSPYAFRQNHFEHDKDFLLTGHDCEYRQGALRQYPADFDSDTGLPLRTQPY